MRTTAVTPQEDNSPLLQTKLDQMWTLLEDHYDEEWSVEADGTIYLVLDAEMLEQVLDDNTADAWYMFGAFHGGQTQDGERFFVHRPEYLKGRYSIKGVYDASQRLVDGARTYFFTKGEF